MLWNVRSLSNNLKHHFVQQTLEDESIDVACITETWLSPEFGQDHTVSEIKNFGFNVSLTSRKGRRGGGVAIFVKNNLNFSALKFNRAYTSFEWNGVRIFGIATIYLLYCMHL